MTSAANTRPNIRRICKAMLKENYWLWFACSAFQTAVDPVWDADNAKLPAVWGKRIMLLNRLSNKSGLRNSSYKGSITNLRIRSP